MAKPIFGHVWSFLSYLQNIPSRSRKNGCFIKFRQLASHMSRPPSITEVWRCCDLCWWVLVLCLSPWHLDERKPGQLLVGGFNMFQLSTSTNQPEASCVYYILVFAYTIYIPGWVYYMLVFGYASDATEPGWSIAAGARGLGSGLAHLCALGVGSCDQERNLAGGISLW